MFWIRCTYGMQTQATVMGVVDAASSLGLPGVIVVVKVTSKGVTQILMVITVLMLQALRYPPHQVRIAKLLLKLVLWKCAQTVFQ